MNDIVITREIAVKVLETIDAGLVKGVGKPIPGQMCVEAAVCFALGLPHGDEPICVSRALRSLKIRLNDSRWSSDASRAKGMRRLALAQLGSAGVLDDKAFLERVVEMTISKIVPRALRSAAGMKANAKHADNLEAAAKECEAKPTRDSALKAKIAAADAADATAAYAADAADAYAAAYAATAAYAASAATASAAYAADAAAAYAATAAYARDEALAFFAEEVVKILIEMKAPGCQWLDLTGDAA